MTAPWQREHWLALYEPQGPEIGIIGLLRAWTAYADAYRETHERSLADSLTLGPSWGATCCGYSTATWGGWTTASWRA